MRVSRGARDASVELQTILICVRARRVLSRRGLPGALKAFDLEPVPPDTPAGGGRWSPQVRHLARVAGVLLDTPPVKSTCLPTALSLSEVLRRHGVPSDVVIGISATDGFTAHAWVDLPEGRIDLSRHPLAAHSEMARFRHRGPSRSS